MAKTGSIKKLFTLFIEQVSQADVGKTAVLMAYYILLSLFPLAIALGNILSFFNIDPANILPYLDDVVPEVVRSVLNPIIEQLLTTGNGGLFTLSMVGVLWGASRGVAQLDRGLDLAYGVTDKRNNFIQTAMSVVAVVVVLLLTVALIIVFGLGGMLFDALAPVIPEVAQIGASIIGLRWPVTLVLLFGILLIFYIRAPSVKVRIRDALPGVLFAVVGWLVLAVTFSIYLRFITNSLSTYGVLSTFFVLMFWLNFASMIILFGAVLNAVVYKYRQGEYVMKKYPISQKINQRLEKIVKKFMPKKKAVKDKEE